MISSDKNVENIGQLVEELKHYLQLQKEYVVLDGIDKVVRIGAALVLGVVCLVLFLLVLFYLSFAVVYWIAPYVGTGWAYAIVSGFFLLVLAGLVLLRKPLIERPLVKFLSETLLN